LLDGAIRVRLCVPYIALCFRVVGDDVPVLLEYCAVEFGVLVRAVTGVLVMVFAAALLVVACMGVAHYYLVCSIIMIVLIR